MQRWVGRVALVTGASSGIGVGICKRLVEGGMKVVGAARRVDRIEVRKFMIFMTEKNILWLGTKILWLFTTRY